MWWICTSHQKFIWKVRKNFMCFFMFRPIFILSKKPKHIATATKRSEIHKIYLAWTCIEMSHYSCNATMARNREIKSWKLQFNVLFCLLHTSFLNSFYDLVFEIGTLSCVLLHSFTPYFHFMQKNFHLTENSKDIINIRLLSLSFIDTKMSFIWH